VSLRIDLLVEVLDEAFAGPAWHGPTLLSALRGVTPAEAVWRPGPGRHCTWDLLLHAAYWKYVARRRIEGGKRGSFERTGSDFFALPEPADDAALRDDMALLRAEHDRLKEVVARLRDADLERKPGRGRWTVADTIRGVALHDVYHAGQIRLLERLRQAAGAR
jgi:hypothetical protein